MNGKIKWILVLFPVSLGILHCSQQIAGGTSEQTNSYARLAFVYNDLSPAGGVSIRIRPKTWVQGETAVSFWTLDTLTSPQGVVHIESIPDGEYYLEALDTVENTGVYGALIALSLHADAGYEGDPETLHAVGTLRGHIAVEKGGTESLRITVPGLD